MPPYSTVIRGGSTTFSLIALRMRAMAVPRSRFSVAAVTTTDSRRFSRCSSVWPGSKCTSATCSSLNVAPDAAERIGSARSASTDLLASGVTRTRMSTSRPRSRIDEATRPASAVSAASATSVADTPNAAARIWSTCSVIAGPLTTTPLFVSTTPGIASRTSWISSALARSASASSEKTLISIGCDELMRSLIRSTRIPGSSTSRTSAGNSSAICSRISDLTSSVVRDLSALSLTRKSPVFGSVTKSPSSAPVRRE